MGIAYNPRVVTDGLVLCLDAANPKGYDITENLLTYSKDFSSGWSSSLTVTLNNAVAPDGTLTAAKIQRPLNSGNSNIQQNPVLSTNTNYCYSAFIKLASSPDPTNSICSLSSANNLISPVYASISYNFATGTISTFGNLPSNSGVIAYPDGWYRIYMVINTSTQTNASLEIRPASNNTVSDFYIWGAQLERGSSPSPYYPTSGTAKNRGTTWTDLSGRGNNGTLVNGVGYNSGNGGFLVFDGTDDVVTCGNDNSIKLLSNLSLECWIKFGTQIYNYTGIISKTLDNTNGYELRTALYTSTTTEVEFRYKGDVAATGRVILQNNTWYHIVATGESGSQKFYVNRVLPTTNNVSTTPDSNNNNLQIGKLAYAGLYCNASISIVRIYNKALSAQEIQQNFNATRSRFSI